jgi:hypothetical protein
MKGRTTKGQHVKNSEAADRARKRKASTKKGNIGDVAAIPKATMDEELKQFKAICRYILNNDL